MRERNRDEDELNNSRDKQREIEVYKRKREIDIRQHLRFVMGKNAELNPQMIVQKKIYLLVSHVNESEKGRKTCEDINIVYKV